MLPTGFRTFHFVSFLYVFFFSFLFLLFRFFSHYFVFVFLRFVFFRFFSLLFSLFSFRFFSFRFFSFFFSVSQFTGTPKKPLISEMCIYIKSSLCKWGLGTRGERCSIDKKSKGCRLTTHKIHYSQWKITSIVHFLIKAWNFALWYIMIKLTILAIIQSRIGPKIGYL